MCDATNFSSAVQFKVIDKPFIKETLINRIVYIFGPPESFTVDRDTWQKRLLSTF